MKKTFGNYVSCCHGVYDIFELYAIVRCIGSSEDDGTSESRKWECKRALGGAKPEAFVLSSQKFTGEDLSATVQLVSESKDTRFRFVTKYVDDTHWSYIAYDTGKWLYELKMEMGLMQRYQDCQKSTKMMRLRFQHLIRTMA